MKYVVLIPDGAADHPLKELSSKTPLEVADMPNIKKLASKSFQGLAQTIPEGFTAGSDVANLSILGYDPHKYYSGRGPIEAAFRGIETGDNDTVFRCNLITVKEGKIFDYSASHISTDEAKVLIEKLEKDLGSDIISFFPGMSYRHLTVIKDCSFSGIDMVPPHDAIGMPVEDLFPKEENAKLLIDLTLSSSDILKDHPVNKKREERGLNPANMIWLWGGGRKKQLPSFKDRFGVSGGVISAVDLIKGLAVSMGLEAVNVETATGYFDTDYEGKARASLDILEENDFVYVHVEAPDEAGHTGNIEEKIKALENFDERLVGTMLESLDLEQTKILLLPDHATPISLKTHTSEPVPYLIYPGDQKADGYSEEIAGKMSTGVVKGYDLMKRFIRD